MNVAEQNMLSWCRTLLGASPAPYKTLGDYLAAIPRLESLASVPRGTAVLVRGDVDAKPGAKIGEGDQRLRSMVDTLKFGIERGWKQIVFGHIGRKPEGSLNKVAARLGELLGKSVPLVSDWLGRCVVNHLAGGGRQDSQQSAWRCAGAGKHAAL